MREASTRFSNDLGRIVKRLSKSPEFDASILEMAGHFEDIFEESLLTEKSEALAEQMARKRLGNLQKIAFQIVSSPARVTRGLRIQIGAIITFFSMEMIYLASVCFFIESLARSGFLNQIVNAAQYVFGLAGLAMGFGIYLSRKVAWRFVAANFALLLVISSVVIFKGAGPENIFHMSRAQARDVVARQTEIEPRILRIENGAKALINPGSTTPTEFEARSEALRNTIQADNTPFFAIKSGDGKYLYPEELTYPNDPVSYYRATMAQTDDIALAKGKWSNHASVASQLTFAMQARGENFEAYRNFANSRPTHWTFGLNMGAILSIGSTGIFLMLAYAAYLLALVRVYGLSWFRLVRA